MDPRDRRKDLLLRRRLRHADRMGQVERRRQQTGWVKWNADGKLSYFGPDGAMYTGTKQVNGVTYNFGTSGKIAYQYVGFQNPKSYYQVSCYSVSIKNQGIGIFGYRTPSQIPFDATRQDCVNAMIARAYDYVGDPYVWDYSCAPGIGVDCAGLVMQTLYATGMDLSPMNPWDHYYTPGHDAYANYMWNNGRFQRVSWADRKPGDIVCSPGHVQIYIGSGKVIEAYSPAVGVRITKASSSGVRGLLRPLYSKE